MFEYCLHAFVLCPIFWEAYGLLSWPFSLLSLTLMEMLLWFLVKFPFRDFLSIKCLVVPLIPVACDLRLASRFRNFCSHYCIFCSGRVKYHDFVKVLRLKTCTLSEEVSYVTICCFYCLVKSKYALFFFLILFWCFSVDILVFSYQFKFSIGEVYPMFMLYLWIGWCEDVQCCCFCNAKLKMM